MQGMLGFQWEGGGWESMAQASGIWSFLVPSRAGGDDDDDDDICSSYSEPGCFLSSSYA